MSGYKKFAAGIWLVVISCGSWFISSCSQPVTTTVSIKPPDADNPVPETTPSTNPSTNQSTTAKLPAVTKTTPTETPTTTTPPPTADDSTPTGSPPVTSSVLNIDIASYSLNIKGLVNTPFSLSYAQIQSYPVVTQNVEVICPDTEDEWDEWTGVPVAALLKQAGLMPGASEVVFTGLDGYYTQLPLETALQDGVFLAYKMNGETLLPDRGYPLRLVVKGSLGNYWMRWVTKIEVKPALVSFTNSAAVIQGLGSNTPTAGNKLCSCILRSLNVPFKL
jgi:DMSO/TMAO reductase YedYZ molybdopterin-dependent catalytic subunit